MKKTEMLMELNVLLKEKGMLRIDGINSNSNKEEIENAIECLKCSDEELEARLKKIKKLYPNIFNLITEGGEMNIERIKYHSHNRLFVYNNGK